MPPYRFVFTDWFNRCLRQLGKRNPQLRTDFEAFLRMLDAEAHPVIPGTGGVRKAHMKVTGRGLNHIVVQTTASHERTGWHLSTDYSDHFAG
jgi:hypothetical protein